MNFIETLKLWDTAFFLLLNGIHSTFFDGFMFAISAKLTWVPLYLALIFIIIKSRKKEAVWIILALILCIVLADQISSGIIKNLVQRLRPSHNEDLKDIVHLVHGSKSGMYGFVSSHAANAFGLATLTSLFFRNKLYSTIIFLWAVSLAYSRIYLGVHYPLDVLGGGIVGVMVAFLLYLVVLKFRPTAIFHREKNEFANYSGFFIPLSVIGISYFVIILYSIFIFQ